MQEQKGWKPLSRRDFLRMAGTLAAGTVLAACAPKTAVEEEAKVEKKATPVAKETPTTPPTKEPVALQYWVGWPQYDRVVEALQATAEWKEALGNNTCEIRTGVRGEVWSANFAAGTPPDVGSCGTDHAARGQLVPLDDFIAQSEVIRPDVFVPGQWENNIWEGKVYKIAANEAFLVYGLNYNAKLVGEAGLDPDNPPTTWDELLAWHEKLTKFDDAGNLLRIGLDPYNAVGGKMYPSHFCVAHMWGVNVYDPEEKKFRLDDPRVVEAFETTAEFVRIVGPDNLAGFRGVEGQGTWGAAYNAEVEAMIIEGYWHPGETMNEAPDVGKVNRATWLPMPAFRKGVKLQVAQNSTVGLFKGEATHPEEAWPIIEFLMTKAACDILFQTLGWLPGLQSYYDTVDPSVYPGLSFYFQSVKEATEWAPLTVCPIDGFVYSKGKEIREIIYRDQMTAAEALKMYQEQCQAELESAGFA